MSAHRTTWTSAGLLLTLLAGSPVLADDTELMLVKPATAAEDKPNILFILDTSGSMKETVSTLAPYNGTQSYPKDGVGECDSTRLYWTDVDVVPDCASGTDPATSRSVAKSAFVCAAAEGQLRGIGSYTGTMVQHRPTDVPDVSRWQELLPGDLTDFVECQADSGVDGDGIDTDALWASNGSDGTVFTSDSTLEIGWGSAPAAVTYTVYDGNYLNWKNSANKVDLPKIDILKAVTKAVLESITGVNVGVMRFNDNDGGAVIKAMSDLDSSRADLLATVDSLDATASTPLAETLYESALYWRGLPAHYGEIIHEHDTDPDALDTAEPEDYKQPPMNMCPRNFNVLVTDGEPNDDEDTPGLIQNLPDFPLACDGTGQGHCLDDLAEYLSTDDIDAAMDGKQFVTTHTIGFDVDIPILRDTAEESGGTYFLADDVESLALAMLKIVGDIKERSLSFTSPSIAVNSFNRTQNLNDLYLTVFSSRPHVHWPGNLKKFAVAGGQIVDDDGHPAVDPATGFFFNTAKSIWTIGGADGDDVTRGGAAQQLPNPDARKLYTNNGSDPELIAANNALTPSNATAFLAGDFGLTGATGEPSITDMIRWMRGVDIRDEDSTTTVRHAMGDPLHSQPAAVVYGGNAAAPDVVVFTATNDGYLHAIDGDDGSELWSFVPKELLKDMNRLFFDPKVNFKHYGIDGNIVPVLNDENNNGVIESGDFVYILFGLRRGGHSYYALDVTDRNSPKLLWMKQLPESGQSWSTPVVARVNIDDDDAINDEKAVVIIGGGYDPVHDTPAAPQGPDVQGAGIYMLDLETGALLWGPDDAVDLPAMTRAIPTSIRVLDISGDGFADRMYAADLGGQIWRFDISNGQPAATLVAGGVIAQLGAEGLESPTSADTRRFYNSPDVAIFTDPLGRRFLSISIGSGYRAHPFDNDAGDRFFSIRDPDVFNQLTQDEYDDYDVVTDADLQEVSGQVRVTIDSNHRGWKFSLPADQKVLADSVTFDNSVFFVGFSPTANVSDPCLPTFGHNFLYRVSVVNGDPVVNNLDTLIPEDADAARVTELGQSGIAPTPSVLFPGTAADCEGEECNAPPPLIFIGLEPVDPGFVNNPVRTLWTEEGLE